MVLNRVLSFKTANKCTNFLPTRYENKSTIGVVMHCSQGVCELEIHFSLMENRYILIGSL
jgi:hypothetical protein